MSLSQYRLYILFRGLLNSYGQDDDEDDLEFGEIDAKAFDQAAEINRLQPNRDPRLELDYLGDSGHLELIFNFRTTWIDRESDVEDYLDDVQGVIENGMDMIITEREMLGSRQES
jgi:hypothetical protein